MIAHLALAAALKLGLLRGTVREESQCPVKRSFVTASFPEGRLSSRLGLSLVQIPMSGSGTATRRGKPPANSNVYLAKVSAQWALSPLFEANHFTRAKYPSGVAVFEETFQESIQRRATVLELAMADGLRFDLVSDNPRSCHSMTAPDVREAVERATFMRVFGIVSVPVFHIQDVVTHASSKIVVDFSLPTRGDAPNRSEIPLKGRIPHTYNLTRPFFFLMRDGSGSVLFEGWVAA